ncbi:MAG: DUF695 domain-containing protein [Acidimicrobiales bacterium]
MGLFRRSAPLDPRQSRGGRWAETIGTHNGSPMTVSYRTDIRRSIGHPSFPFQIHLTVPMNDVDFDGRPSETELASLSRFEDEVLVPLCHERAVMTLVVTAAGLREYVFYASADDWVKAFEAQVAARWAAHRVSCRVRRDPRWDAYRAFAR